MDFRIADTFTDSLARLTAAEQKAAKTSAFDLQLDPSSPALRFHRLDRAKDPNFWSIRVSADIRIIVHRTASSLLLCHVAHHDAAYAWAERRKIERHPATGAAQLVEIRERVEEVVARAPAASPAAAPAMAPLFAGVADAALLGYGVPAEWLADVRGATEDTLLDLVGHLPQEAAEALLNLAVGATPPPAEPVPPETDPFAHPDAQRRFRVVTDVAELARALEYPWERWAVFLHPGQRRLVERPASGPVRVAGSAGTGKTVVALHRAVFLARRRPDARVLLTTFSRTLAHALRLKLDHLTGGEPDLASRITVEPLRDVTRALHRVWFGEADIVSDDEVRSLLAAAAKGVPGLPAYPRFLPGEWADVVDAWQIGTWEAYRDVARLGRKTRLGERQRRALWSVFARVRDALAARGSMTWADLMGRVGDRLATMDRRPFDHAVVDEAQDLAVAEARLLANLTAGEPDALFLAGDLGQRIFQLPFSWKGLGIDVRGRSHTLRINYRTSQEIRSRADRLLPASLADVDGIAESRRGTISVLNGPAPAILIHAGAAPEAKAVGTWIAERLAHGLLPHEIGIFVRSEAELPRARDAAKAAGATSADLDDTVGTVAGRIAVGTMHRAKGLEFRAVAVMACDDEIIPSQERIEAVADDADLEEVYDTERHLLYVACTRARDHLLVTGVAPGSEFLRDLGPDRR